MLNDSALALAECLSAAGDFLTAHGDNSLLKRLVSPYLQGCVTHRAIPIVVNSRIPREVHPDSTIPCNEPTGVAHSVCGLICQPREPP